MDYSVVYQLLFARVLGMSVCSISSSIRTINGPIGSDQHLECARSWLADIVGTIQQSGVSNALSGFLLGLAITYSTPWL